MLGEGSHLNTGLILGLPADYYAKDRLQFNNKFIRNGDDRYTDKFMEYMNGLHSPVLIAYSDKASSLLLQMTITDNGPRHGCYIQTCGYQFFGQKYIPEQKLTSS